MQVENVAIKDVKPYPGNPRKNRASVGKVADSIKEFGFRQPIVVDEEMVVLAGHTRLDAAKRLKLKKVPIHIAVGLSAEQAKAYRIMDNRSGEDSHWNQGLLKIEVQDLLSHQFDLQLTGFTGDEIANLLADPSTDQDDGEEDGRADRVPHESPKVCSPGDLWILGDHRLVCGDSTDKDAVKRLMAGDKADLLFTSPPYAQQRDYGTAKENVQDWDNLMRGVFGSMLVTKKANVLVNLGLVHADRRVNIYWNEWLVWMSENDWPLFAWYVWDQGHGMPGNHNGRLAPSHEFIFHFCQDPGQPNKWVDKQPDSITDGRNSSTGFRKKDGSIRPISSPEVCNQPRKIADSIIRVNRNPTEAQKTNHPAVFPTKLCEYMYSSFVIIGARIYDPFTGSGTTVIACERSGMNAYCMEVDPDYCDSIIDRWQRFTDKEAVREGT